MVDVSLSVGHRGLRAMARALRSGRALGLLGVALPVLAGCGEKNAYVPPPPPKVVVAQPLQQDVPLYVELTGNTKAFNEVKLEARVQGFLEQIKYVDGAAVKKGDLLFVIQQSTYQAQLDQAKATLEANKASQANAQVEYSRQSTLGQQQSPPSLALMMPRPSSPKPAPPSSARKPTSRWQTSTSATQR